MLTGGLLGAAWGILIYIVSRVGLEGSSCSNILPLSLFEFLNPIVLLSSLLFLPSFASLIAVCKMEFLYNPPVFNLSFLNMDFLYVFLNIFFGFLWGVIIWGSIIHFIISRWFKQ